jgi:hypothetical protein
MAYGWYMLGIVGVINVMDYWGYLLTNIMVRDKWIRFLWVRGDRYRGYML